jgi:hypothetical protein
MGTTATSLHVLSAVVGVGSRLSEDIEKAYRKLGYARPKKAGGGATKRVILAPDTSGDWLSKYAISILTTRFPTTRLFSVNRHGRFRDSGPLRQVFEAVGRACMDAGQE